MEHIERLRGTAASSTTHRSKTRRSLSSRMPDREDPAAMTATSRRPKSRSPSRTNTRSIRPLPLSSRIRTDPFLVAPIPPPKSIRRKKSTPSVHTSAAVTAASASSGDEAVNDCGQRVKSLPAVPTSQEGFSSRTKKNKERERHEIKSHHAHPSTKTSLKERDVAMPLAGYSGPIAAAEFERMRKEIEGLRKTVHDNAKTIKKQAKLIEELKSEANSAKLMKQDHESRYQNLQAKSKANEELISTIETSLQCQICMELLSKPFALSPCGHILCVSCLQEWFRKAPPSAEDEMDIENEDDPDYIMHREKSCPCCRAVVVRKPVPIFVVKSITSSLVKAKSAIADGTSGGPLTRRGSSPPVDEDPWKGLFPEDADDGDMSEEDYAGDAYSEDDDDLYLEMGGLHGMIPGPYDDDISSSVGTDDDGFYSQDEVLEPYQHGETYIHARWEPPALDVEATEDLNTQELSLLRRGCTNTMVDLYGMRYTHHAGLIAYVTSLDGPQLYFDRNHVDRVNRLFLGWNIRVAEWDEDGEVFVTRVLEDLREHPEKWNVSRRPGTNAVDARRLVRMEPGEVLAEYDTTDSEKWVD